MIKLLKLEELAQFLLCLVFLLQQELGIVVFLLIFFAPDVFALGFLINNRGGTMLYNFSHHKFVAVSIIATGYLLQHDLLLHMGVIIFSHICFDRTLGYGLKYVGTAHKTHLGFIGKQKHQNPPDHF